MSDTNNGGGIGIAGATFIVFLTLKLTHVIDWSWWWVTAPLWIPGAFVLALLLIGGVLIGLGRALGATKKSNPPRNRGLK